MRDKEEINRRMGARKGERVRARSIEREGKN
jgi:hypothetical protein